MFRDSFNLSLAQPRAFRLPRGRPAFLLIRATAATQGRNPRIANSAQPNESAPITTGFTAKYKQIRPAEIRFPFLSDLGFGGY